MAYLDEAPSYRQEAGGECVCVGAVEAVKDRAQLCVVVTFPLVLI